MARKWLLIFQLQLTPENWKLFALENGITNIRNETQGASSGLAALFWDELYRVKRLNEWEHEKLEEKGFAVRELNESSPILLPWRK